MQDCQTQVTLFAWKIQQMDNRYCWLLYRPSRRRMETIILELLDHDQVSP